MYCKQVRPVPPQSVLHLVAFFRPVPFFAPIAIIMLAGDPLPLTAYSRLVHSSLVSSVVISSILTLTSIAFGIWTRKVSVLRLEAWKLQLDGRWRLQLTAWAVVVSHLVIIALRLAAHLLKWNPDPSLFDIEYLFSAGWITLFEVRIITTCALISLTPHSSKFSRVSAAEITFYGHIFRLLRNGYISKLSQNGYIFKLSQNGCKFLSFGRSWRSWFRFAIYL
jgi:hypothetical protein